MNEEEQALAEEIYQALMDASNKSDRSLQSADFRLGISDIGFCPERNRRLMDHQVPEDTDALAAFIGTAIGDHAEQAIKAAWPEAIIQGEVHLDLRVQGKAYRLPGHPDVIEPKRGLALDGKTVRGLNAVTRMGSSFAQQWQRNAYALAAWQEGWFGNLGLDEIKVGNYWIDRAADHRRVHVELTPFDENVIAQGIEEIESTVYALMNNEETEKRPERNICETVCGFWRVCRQYDTDVSGLLDNPETVFNIVSYYEGNQLEKQGAQMKDEAKAALVGLSGSTGKHTLRWIWNNPSADGKRAGFYRIDVREVKR